MTNSVYYALKQRLYARYNHRIDNPEDRKRSAFFAEWLDVGFARHRWTNEGEIAPGVIRANNPDEKRFKDYAERGVRTVVNLRHDVERSPVKFAEERTKANGMTYISYPMRPRRAPSKEELLGLRELFNAVEKPVLIHCKSGADRTGLIAAIWRLTQENEPLSIAQTELSLKYIHRRDSDTGVLDEVLDAYADFEDELGFFDWAEAHYDGAELDRRALAAKPQRGLWGSLKHFYKDVYTYAQHREARWHKSFEKEIETEDDRRRANFFMTWVDHGVLRRVWHNYHEIAPGVFRSNHPTEARFRAYAAQGIKTVLNLRGASLAPQYQLEAKLCEELGLDLIDIEMHAVAPPKDIMHQLLDAFERAEKPMMMHCKSGADRTGLASALYLITQGVSVPEARKQLALRYLHLKNGKKGVLGWVLNQYEADNTDGSLTLRDWVNTKYNPDHLSEAFHAQRQK